MILGIDFEGKHYTVEVGQKFCRINGELPPTMAERYRLDTAVRMLVGVLKDNCRG